MAKQTMIDTTVLVGGASDALDVSGQANRVEFTGAATPVDVTTFSQTRRRRIAALEDAGFSLGVYDEDAANPWNTLTDLFGASDAFWAWIESNSSMAEQDRGIMLRSLANEFSRGGAIGEARKMEISGVGDGPIVMAQVLQQDESLTTSGSSTGFQFGSLASGETLYCVAFCLSVTAGSIACTIESDDNSGFTSATTRATFTTFTGTATEQQTVAGAVTDDWWRHTYTVTTGPATVVVMIGKR